MRTLVVTAAIIRRDDQILLAQRREDDPLSLLWEFPGGKIIPGESPEHCLLREIKEELSIDIKVGAIFQVVSHIYSARDLHIILLAYHCRYVAGEPQPLECNDFKWVTVEELIHYQMAPADIPIVKMLLTER